MIVWPGTPYPLGAIWDGADVNLALFSEIAEMVDLSLLDDGDGGRTETRIALTEVDDFVWALLHARRRARPALWVPGSRSLDPIREHRTAPRSCLSTW